ncbi:MAG: hypothetical protein A3J75_01145 [Acidobacteria bacterium RBG_16_68_9]|nr:MAG: hypothetical protein A3J75_01145 [Acidobacteria bacterium RBG_16_68_9]
MSAADPFVGTLFAGRFHIERPLAAGGMGAVYIAVQQPAGRKVALKLIKGAGAADPDMVARFHREIGVMSGLNHPNVVTMFDSGVDNGHVFLVMELLNGRSLRDEIEALRVQGQPRMPWPRALRILHHVARGLAAVHQSGVVHRDLKPENIFLTASAGLRDFAKLLDFGIVRHESMTETQRLTQTGGIIGTPGYLSPEQLTGSAATPLSDVYALGVILYELVTGEFPFAAPTLQAMAVKQLIGPVVPPADLAPDLPEGVVALISSLMSREPAHRPRIDTLLHDLEDLLAETSGPVVRAPPYLGGTETMQRPELQGQGVHQPASTEPLPPRGSRGGEAQGAVAPATGTAPPLAISPAHATAPTEVPVLFAPAQATRRSPVLWVAAGGIAGVVVVAVALLLFQNRQPATPAPPSGAVASPALPDPVPEIEGNAAAVPATPAPAPAAPVTTIPPAAGPPVIPAANDNDGGPKPAATAKKPRPPKPASKPTWVE